MLEPCLVSIQICHHFACYCVTQRLLFHLWKNAPMHGEQLFHQGYQRMDLMQDFATCQLEVQCKYRGAGINHQIHPSAL